MAESNYQADRVAELAHAVMHHKRLYYQGKPEISDQEYDALEGELQRLAPGHPALAFVGTDTEISGKKAEHAVPMLSLAKTYDEAELAAWMDDQQAVGMYKVDGNSLSLIYEKGQLVMAKTRGNGRLGEVVTEKAHWIADLLPQIPDREATEIRGELYCSGANFILLSDELAALDLERPTSPRNIVAGLLGRKSHFHLARYFNFLAFDVLPLANRGRFKREMEKFQWLEVAGFKVPSPELLHSVDEAKAYLQKVKLAMTTVDYGLDGAVFSYDDLQLHAELGNTSHHPRYKMSFKWQGQTATSVVERVGWTTSRLGVVTPVAIIKPVFLSGAQITNVTLHNAAHVVAYNLKAGDEIELVRSGEVIPKFLGVLSPGEGEHVLPAKCPECDTKLEYDGIRLRCSNALGCPAQQMRSILNWIRCVDIEDLSEKRLEQLLQAGLLKSIPDLYSLTVEKFLQLPMTKEKMANKLFSNIQASKTTSLAQFLNGLGIEGAGQTTWEKLLEVFPSLKAIRAATVEEMAGINGFAEKSAQQIATGLKQKAALIDEILAAGVKPRAPKPVARVEGPLTGKTLVITGALSQPRGEVEAMIKAGGGHTSGSVSKNTFAVVTNDQETTSSKMRKAKELGIPVWSEADLLQFLQG